MRAVILSLAIVVQTVAWALIEGSDPAMAGGMGSYLGNYLAAAIEHSGALLLLAAAVAVTMRRDRGADLSAAAVCVLAAAVVQLLFGHVPFWGAAVPIGVALAVVIGVMHALMIRRLNMPPLGVTGATLVLVSCAVVAVTRQIELTPVYTVTNLSMLSRPVVIGPATVGVFVLLGIAQRWTSLLRRVWALYPLAGLIVGGAAVIHLAERGSAEPGLMVDLQLAAVVAALLGGMRLTASRGSLGCAGLAAANLALLHEGMISVTVRFGQPLGVSSRVMYLVIVATIGLLILGLRRRAARRGARGKST